jgi:hypothetical protein
MLLAWLSQKRIDCIRGLAFLLGDVVICLCRRILLPPPGWRV